jgi:hypothetical protein
LKQLYICKMVKCIYCTVISAIVDRGKVTKQFFTRNFSNVRLNNCQKPPKIASFYAWPSLYSKKMLQ